MQATSVLLLTVASLAAVLGVQPEEVKTEAAAGRWNHRPIWQPFVQDRFVCDLDASVLLVVDSNRHHHRGGYFNGPSPANRAVRVKCSEVANNDEDSCNFCCQQTARRDTSLPNNKLFGFLAITKSDDEQTFTRTKRDIEDDDDEDEDREDRRRHRNGGRFHKVESTFVGTGKWTPDDYDTNVKCVCCAPRATAPAQSPSTYNTAAASPSAYSSLPAASAPSTYGSNTFVQPQPIASAQPLVDSWQQSDSATWGAASDVPAAAPAVTPAPVAASNAY